MFTGIIQHQGTVAELTQTLAGLRLLLDAPDWGRRADHGESISVNGCCLTVASQDGSLAFDVIPQTLANTTLGNLRPGDRVNLEACLTPASLLGGHLVQGHVDGVGEITAVENAAAEWRVRIALPEALRRFVVPRGSIAVDGVSLTIAECGPDWLDVALIPTTLSLTTLGQARPGRRVNLEADLIAKTVVLAVERMQGDFRRD